MTKKSDYSVQINTDILIKPLESKKELSECMQLQRKIWGNGPDAGIIPASVLKINEFLGGITAGAFNKEGLLVGFIFSMPGRLKKKWVHWSFRLAVEPAYRQFNTGQALKTYQKDRSLKMGFTEIYWSFDPLESRNAHININKLKAVATQYVENMYALSESKLHKAIGTDRLMVKWDLAEDPLIGSEINPDTLLIANASPAQLNQQLQGFRIEIPDDIQGLKQSDPEKAVKYRSESRNCFKWAFENGYKVHSFYRTESTHLGYYIIIKEQSK
jgi:predicted GNAT superfamily acetyltransferase